MKIKHKLISPKDILTYYHDEVRNEEAARSIIAAEKGTKNWPMTLAVEEVSKGKYFLIENFEYSSALKQIQPNTHIPCLVYPNKGDRERLLYILKRGFTLEKKTSWVFKNEHVIRLIRDHHLTPREVAKRTKINENTIKSYILDNRIPAHIREKAIQMDVKSILKEISHSHTIPNQMKPILYEKAVLEKDCTCQLTHQKLKYMNAFCSANTLPISLLNNCSKLECLVHELLSTNFEIHNHMRDLLYVFLIENDITHGIDPINLHQELSLH